MAKGKITSKAEHSNQAGKTWFSVGIDGKSYSTFDKKTYDGFAIGDEINYETVTKGQYVNLKAMWKDGETPPQPQVQPQSNARPNNQREEAMSEMNRLSNRRTCLETATNWLIELSRVGALHSEQLRTDEPQKLANQHSDWLHSGED